MIVCKKKIPGSKSGNQHSHTTGHMVIRLFPKKVGSTLFLFGGAMRKAIVCYALISNY